MAGRKSSRGKRRNKRRPQHREVTETGQTPGTTSLQIQPFRSLLKTAGLQLAAFWGTISLIPLLSVPISPTLIHLISALILARVLKLTPPWQLCNVFIPLGLMAPVGSVIPLSLLIVTLLIFGPTLKAPIPFYPTRPRVYQHLADVIAAHSPRRCVDLGSGFGSVLFALAKPFPAVSFFGYETGLLPLFSLDCADGCITMSLYIESLFGQLTWGILISFTRFLHHLQ